jgi:hypothetical protein
LKSLYRFKFTPLLFGLLCPVSLRVVTTLTLASLKVRELIGEAIHITTSVVSALMSRRSVSDPAAFKRGNYMRVLSSYVARS